MNCQNCGAPLTPVTEKNYLYCRHCTTFYFPAGNRDQVEVLHQPAHLACPYCRTEMVTAVVDGLQVVHCNKCRGLLIQQSTFSKLLRSLRANLPGMTEPKKIEDRELNRKLDCPNCGKVMDTHPYAGPGNIVIDLCLDCRFIWLDYGELYLTSTAPGRDRAWLF